MAGIQSASKNTFRSSDRGDGSSWSSQPVAKGIRNSERSGVQSVTWDDLARLREQGDDQTKNYQVPPELIELARANRKGRGSVGTLTPVAPRPGDAESVDVVVPAAGAAPLVEPSEVLEGLSAPPVACDDLTPSAVARVAVESAIVARGTSREEIGEAPSVTVDSERYPMEEPLAEEPGVAPLHEAAAEQEAAPASQLESSRLREYAPIMTGAAIIGAYVTLCYFANALFSALP